MYIHAHCLVIYRSVKKMHNKSISGKGDNGEFSSSVLHIYVFQFLRPGKKICFISPLLVKSFSLLVQISSLPRLL